MPLLWLILFSLSFLFKENKVAQNKTKNDSTLSVERWEEGNMGMHNGDTIILERRVYNDNNLISYTRYNYGTTCPFLDSSIYDYSGNKLIEFIRYIPQYCDTSSICGYRCYSCNDNTIPSIHVCIKEANRVKFFYNSSNGFDNNKTVSNNTPEGLFYSELLKPYNFVTNPNINTINNFGISDTLGLLSSYDYEILEATNFVRRPKNDIIKSDSFLIKKISFVVNRPIRIFSDYSIYNVNFLKSMVLYIKENKLIDDEFLFKGIIIRRQYKYIRGLPKEIVITVKEGKKPLRTYVEGFNYKMQ